MTALLALRKMPSSWLLRGGHGAAGELREERRRVGNLPADIDAGHQVDLFRGEVLAVFVLENSARAGRTCKLSGSATAI